MPKLPFSRIEDVTSVTQCNATIVELEPGLFLTPTSKRLMEELGWDGGKNFKQIVSQDIEKVEKVHKNASKANRSKPRVSLGTHTRKIDGIRTTKG